MILDDLHDGEVSIHLLDGDRGGHNLTQDDEPEVRFQSTSSTVIEEDGRLVTPY